jgi:hypothetical protein
MSAHYGVALIPASNKNAMNVLYAVWKGEDASQSENLSQPANATGNASDPITHWFGGRLYDDADLAVIQNMGANVPASGWPVVGVSDSVSESDAEAAAAALVLNVTTQDSYTTEQAQITLNALLTAKGLQRVNLGAD